LAAKITDKELRLLALKLNDPYDQPGLIDTIPTTSPLLGIINIYSSRSYPVVKTYCASCKSKRHREGFTAQVGSSRVLLGSGCGQKLFGESWTVAEKRMTEQSDRQWELFQKDKIDPICTPLTVALNGWIRPFQTILARKSALDRSCGELASRLNEAATTRGGWLTVSSEEKDNRGQKVSTIRNIRPLIGFELFELRDPTFLIEQCQKLLKLSKSQTLNTDSLSTKTLKDHHALRNIFEELEILASKYEKAVKFFSPENLNSIALWTRQQNVTKKIYKYDDDGFGDINGAPNFKWSELPELSSEALELITEFRRAD
jgi:hypothetical protein